MTSPGGLLSDIETWVRRIVKTPSDQVLTAQQIQEYINRFWIYDVPARLQLFELKRQYTFESIPNIFIYQFPYNDYQGVSAPAYADGVQMGFYQSTDQFYNVYPELVLNQTVGEGDGTIGPYTTTFQRVPILRGFTDDLGNLLPYVYFTSRDILGNFVYVVDDGNGVLNQTDATFQTNILPNAGTIDYETGVASFFTSTPLEAGYPIHAQTSPYSAGFPRVMLFFNNTIKLYPVPDRAYKIQMDAYITPSQFLNSASAIPFSYMSEYIARGAARKILSDQADYEMFEFYEKLFREQECQVLRRTDRQIGRSRVPTIFSGTNGPSQYVYTQY